MGTQLNGSYKYVKNELNIDKIFDLKSKAWLILDRDTDISRKFEFDDVTQKATDKLVGFDVKMTCVADVVDYGFNEKKNKYNESNLNTRLKVTILTEDASLEHKLLEDTFVSILDDAVVKNSVVGRFIPDFYLKVENLNFHKTDNESIKQRIALLTQTVQENKKFIDQNDNLDDNVKNRLKQRLDKAFIKSKANLEALEK